MQPRSVHAVCLEEQQIVVNLSQTIHHLLTQYLIAINANGISHQIQQLAQQPAVQMEPAPMIAVVLIGDLVVAMVHQVRGHVRRRQDRIVQKHRIHFPAHVA